MFNDSKDSIDDSSEENPPPTPAKKDTKASTTANGKAKVSFYDRSFHSLQPFSHKQI